MKGQLTTLQAARTFLLGGHAVVTIVSKKTGTRFTYRVIAAPGLQAAMYWISTLTGPENTSDYAYIGLWKPSECRFFRTAKSRVKSDDAPSFAAFRWLLRTLFNGDRDTLPPDLEVWHEGQCGMCGRPLTVPESIASGIGPVCAARGA